MIYKSSNRVISCIRSMHDKANESKDEQQIIQSEKEKMGKQYFNEETYLKRKNELRTQLIPINTYYDIENLNEVYEVVQNKLNIKKGIEKFRYEQQIKLEAQIKKDNYKKALQKRQTLLQLSKRDLNNAKKANNLVEQHNLHFNDDLLYSIQSKIYNIKQNQFKQNEINLIPPNQNDYLEVSNKQEFQDENYEDFQHKHQKIKSIIFENNLIRGQDDIQIIKKEVKKVDSARINKKADSKSINSSFMNESILKILQNLNQQDETFVTNFLNNNLSFEEQKVDIDDDQQKIDMYTQNKKKPKLGAVIKMQIEKYDHQEKIKRLKQKQLENIEQQHLLQARLSNGRGSISNNIQIFQIQQQFKQKNNTTQITPINQSIKSEFKQKRSQSISQDSKQNDSMHQNNPQVADINSLSNSVYNIKKTSIQQKQVDSQNIYPLEKTIFDFSKYEDFYQTGKRVDKEFQINKLKQLLQSKIYKLNMHLQPDIYWLQLLENFISIYVMNKFKLSINSTPDDIKKFTPLFTQILLLKLNEIFKILAIEDTESNKVLQKEDILKILDDIQDQNFQKFVYDDYIYFSKILERIPLTSLQIKKYNFLYKKMYEYQTMELQEI